MMRILYIITARGGSKGVPKKNIKEIGGLPLIAYKIKAAQRCKYEGRIIVSTDDPEIANVAKKYHAEVPFMRPADLASDTASSLDAVMHAIEWTIKDEGGLNYEYLCLLEPSSPFATPDDLNNAFDIIVSSGADTLLGMREVEVSREFIHELDENGGLSLFYDAVRKMSGVRRQDQRKQYTMNGCMYVVKTDYFMGKKSFHSVNSRPYIMPWERSVEIDTEQDLRYAEYLVDTGVIDVNMWKLER